MTFNVGSEIGQLRQVIVHRPGLELSRLTPDNIESLLFDDVLWASKAKEEHDALRRSPARKGRRRPLLRAAACRGACPARRDERLCSTGCAHRSSWGRRSWSRCDASSRSKTPTTLAGALIGGVLKADLHPLHARSLKWDMLKADDFILPPLPNHLFQRDNSCWIYGGVTVNPMAMPARQRESLHTRAIYRFHPLFAERRLRHLLRRRRHQLPAGQHRRWRRGSHRPPGAS